MALERTNPLALVILFDVLKAQETELNKRGKKKSDRLRNILGRIFATPANGRSPKFGHPFRRVELR